MKILKFIKNICNFIYGTLWDYSPYESVDNKKGAKETSSRSKLYSMLPLALRQILEQN